MKFKKTKVGTYFDSEIDFYTQLFLGTLSVNHILVEKDADKINDAIQLITKFMSQGEDEGIFEIE